MNVETLELDLGKRPGSEPTVFCRKGEKGALTLRATIADHGAEVDLSAFGVFFDCVTPDGRLVSDEATSKEGSTAVCTLNEAAMATAGLCKAAYFRLVGQDGSVSTTQDVRIAVLPSAFDADGVAEAYVSEIERLLEECRSEFAANEAARQEASEAATKRANDAADLVEQAVSGNLDPLFAGWIDSKTMTPDDADDAWNGSAAAGLLAGTDAMERFAETAKREFGLADKVDGTTVAYGTKPGGSSDTLHVPAGGIGSTELSDGAVTAGKLDLGSINLTDDPTSSGDASGFWFATPKCVDEKLKAPKDHNVELTGSSIDIESSGVNFNNSRLEVNGYTVASDNRHVIANVAHFAFISFGSYNKSSYPMVFYVNDQEVLKLNYNSTFYSAVVFLNKGDTLKIAAEGYYWTAEQFLIQGV